MISMITYLINLDRRPDRLAECRKNRDDFGFSALEVNRLAACDVPEFGALGCARSHVKALTSFLVEDRHDYCMVLEDDFDFEVELGSFSDKFNGLQDNKIDWDVILLGGSMVVQKTNVCDGFVQVFEANSTCGYIIRRNYLAKLLSCFIEAALALEAHSQFYPRWRLQGAMAIDQRWKILQHRDRWLLFSPRAGLQRSGYSDIEGQHTDYKAVFST